MSNLAQEGPVKSGWLQEVAPDHFDLRVLHVGTQAVLCEAERIAIPTYTGMPVEVDDLVIEVDSHGTAVFHGHITNTISASPDPNHN